MVISKKDIWIRIIIRIIVIISSIYGILKTSTSLKSLTYFTTLSNIFIIAIFLVFLIYDFKALFTKKKTKISNNLYLTKFLATISITLTFLVFLLILAPTMPGGIIQAYLINDAGSLCVHFITPLLAIIDFLIFDYDYKSKDIHILYSIIPPICYVILIIVLSKLGMRWGTMSAPYNFLNYRAETGWFGYNPAIRSWESLGIGVFYMIIILIIIFLILAKVLLLIKTKK